MGSDVRAWVVLGLALALVPVYGFSTGSVPSSTNTAIASEDPYVAAVDEGPVLNASNGYQAPALTVAHQHGSTVTLNVTVENGATDPRFVFPSEGFKLAVDEGKTLVIEDASQDKEPGSYQVEASVGAVTLQDGVTVGYQTFLTTISVKVE